MAEDPIPIEQDREDLFIGVLTDPNSLRTLGMAAYTTWIRDMEPFAMVRVLDVLWMQVGFP